MQSLIAEILRHDRLPGYRQLTWQDRLRVDALAARRVLLSWSGVHVVAALTVWLLAGQIVVWHFDLRGLLADLPFFAAHVWLLPWLAVLRRRAVAKVLGPHWAQL